MAIVQATRLDLEKAKAPIEVMSAIDRIIVNEAEVAIRTVASPDALIGSPVLGADPESPPRNPAFYRLDLRLEKRWERSQARWISFVVEMLNTTLHKEIVSGREIGPISIPSLGVEGGF